MIGEDVRIMSGWIGSRTTCLDELCTAFGIQEDCDRSGKHLRGRPQPHETPRGSDQKQAYCRWHSKDFLILFVPRSLKFGGGVEVFFSFNLTAPAHSFPKW